MTVVMQPTQQNRDALGTDDRLVRGMGISANEILEHLRRLTQMYYESSEVLLNYPPEHARSWITSLFQTVASLGWIKPNVTGGPEGGVVFEWWYGKRKLTVYIEEQSIEYVQVWGTDVDAKITDGSIESVSDSRKLWMWLIGLE